MALVPAVVDAVGNVPVVAAGGIADGRGVAAALALGASGVWVGTRFLATPEAEIHPEYQSRVLSADESDSFYARNLFDLGWPDAPHRALKNSTYAEWTKHGQPKPGERPEEGALIGQSPRRGDVLRYHSHTPGPDDTGNIEAMSMWAGQGLSQVKEIMPAADIVAELWDDANKQLRTLQLE
jgi:NAD(P)H-dependent flavin oxidoreductase YrpB (nitropropane dioxygenase family)